MENVKPLNNKDINLYDVLGIEIYYKTHGFYNKSMIEPLLDYYVYTIRKNSLMEDETIETSSFGGRCGLATDLGVELALKFGFKCYPFNIGDILGTKSIHKVFFIGVPLDNGQVLYLIDPTFKQFCELGSWDVGHLLESTNKVLAERILRYGYFMIGFDDLKVYLDAFKTLYKPNSKEISGEKYWSLIGQNPDDTYKVSCRVIETPLEALSKEKETKMDL